MELFSLVKKMIKFIVFLVVGFWLLFQLYFLINIILYISKNGYNKNDLFKLLFPFVGFIIEMCFLYFIIRVLYNLYHSKSNTNISAQDIAKERKKLTLLGLLIVLIFFIGIFALLDFVAIGPGLPPPKVMPDWYIPKYDHWQGNRNSCISSFPNNISPYCNVGKFSDENVINVWYFDDESNFLTGEDVLYHYLKENGNLSRQEINISAEIHEVYKREMAENTSWEPLVPHLLNITEYTSHETSGYFIVYEKPFLKTREDYFIVYYGTMDIQNFTEEKPLLKKLIVESYYMANEYGKVDGLKESK